MEYIMSLHIAIDADKGQVAESVLLPGDPLRAKYIAETFLENPVCYTDIRNMLGYTGLYKGTPVSVQGTGMGMPSMGIYSWELINEYHVQRLFRIGTAGAFTDKLKIGDVVLALAASTDSNYQHAFDINGTYSPSASWDLVVKAQTAAKENNIEFTAGNVVTCDVFYETLPDWWQKWAKMGVLCVEMETAALYMNAAATGVDALSIITMSDHFVTGAKATVEERQTSFTNMMTMALEAAVA
jgi:purine-nucleoside phosphorylase